MKAKDCVFSILIFVFAINSISASVDLVNTKKQEPVYTIIESLKNGESYAIEITSVGCFGGARQTIVISKESDILTASFPSFSKILNSQDIEAFKTFELQLQALHIGGCSTVDTYVIRYRDEYFQTSDGTCSWNGGKKLLQAIS
jgi:hypothetical protein